PKYLAAPLAEPIAPNTRRERAARIVRARLANHPLPGFRTHGRATRLTRAHALCGPAPDRRLDASEI
ncbi:MAG: hypothetical protein LC647_01810, partial [Beggiatoa sp.]|nr:hypothetical protein [Beggiatoa sp.]